MCIIEGNKIRRKKMKKILILILALTMILSCVPFTTQAAATKYSANVDGVDSDVSGRKIIVFPNEYDTVRTIAAGKYGFNNANLMIFDANGQMIEVGKNIIDGSGSPQLSVKIPAGGFLVALGSGVSGDAKKVFDIAMNDAMLYNATMTVIRDIKCKFNAASLDLDFEVEPDKPETENTKKFLFVGNSTTYFNGTPLKFKALCEAAGLDVSVTYCTNGSAYLSEFADSEHKYGKELRAALNAQKFDYVVLQDAASATENQADAALSTILPLIEDNGAEALLYMRYTSELEPEVRNHNVARYFMLYNNLAEKYSLKYAPIVLAFNHCVETYPEIDLYGDDDSHHSAEGSYLIACTWMYSYFGVSPVGNTYTANLDPDVAAKLQEMAKKGVDEEYDPSETLQSVYEENGKKYHNIAIGKDYTSNGKKYNGNWTETGDDGKPLGKYTDGFAALFGNEAAIGGYSSPEMDITIDLEGKGEIKRITTDLFGGTWGIGDPNNAEISFFVSTDGKKFTELEGTVKEESEEQADDWKRTLYTVTLETPVEATHVKVRYAVEGNFCWLSEINVFSDKSTFKSNTPEESIPDESIPEESIPDESISDESVVDESTSVETSQTEDTSKPDETKNNNVLKTVLGAALGVILAGGVIFYLSKKKKK